MVNCEMAIKGINPKDKIGEKKVSLTKFPAIALVHGASAMVNGADKYGPFNWRENDVVAHIYIDAAMRHLTAWFEGEETAEDSGVHHLGHALACCAILLDAQENGNLIDDRPKSQKDTGWFTQAVERISKNIKRKNNEATSNLPQVAAPPTPNKFTTIFQNSDYSGYAYDSFGNPKGTGKLVR